MSLFFVLSISLLVIIAACSQAEDTEGESEIDETEVETEQESEEATETETAENEIRVGYSAQPDNLDVHVSTAIVTAEVMGHVFETLLTTDAEYNIKPMLAESYEQSDDGKTI